MRWWRRPKFVIQEVIRVNRHGGKIRYICAGCASPYFNDYQWNTRLLAPVKCQDCGIEVRPA